MSTAPRSAAARRNWGMDDSASPILHVDMDSFFASVECALDPTLIGMPIIVGGSRHRGVVTSCTYDVRALGVRAGMPMSRAVALAPHAQIRPGQHAVYREYSRRVMDILSSYTPAFEAASIDEAYLDVSGSGRQFGSSLHIAENARRRVREEVNLPASVGIGRNKTVAKIASAHAKPDGVLLIPAAATEEFLRSLPVAAIPGVGAKTREALGKWGIESVAQLADTEEARLASIIGPSHAYALGRLAQGIDTRTVGRNEVEKSISTEETFAHNLTERQHVSSYLVEASHQCARRLRAAGLRAWTVSIRIRGADFSTWTRSVTVSSPIDVGREIATLAEALFSKEPLPAGGVRLAGVGVSGLVSLSDGVPVPMDHDERPREVESAMDSIRERFGQGALSPATVLGKPWEVSSEMGAAQSH